MNLLQATLVFGFICGLVTGAGIAWFLIRHRDHTVKWRAIGEPQDWPMDKYNKVDR